MKQLKNIIFLVIFFKELGDIGAFGPFIPVEYGGAGMDYIAYGVIMTELERGDSGIRSAASVQTSLVMYPIHALVVKSNVGNIYRSLLPVK